MDYDSKQFYDAESKQYSQKRYEGPLSSYTQYIFRKRREIFLGFLKRALSPEKRVKILDIGCADGVISQKIASTFPKNVEQIVGIDISPMMIEKARELNHDPRLIYFVRDEAPQNVYDIALELGVHVENWDQEMSWVKKNLAPGGYYIFSAAGRTSIHAKIKLKTAPYLKDYKTYKDAEELLNRYFEIVDGKVYGFFVPKLWMIPFVGRTLQPIVDAIFSLITPELFHEKLYLLKVK